MMRFVGVPFTGLLLFAAVACAQNWPSDAQVFRDVFGQVDASGGVRWDASKESNPKSSDAKPFAATGQEMQVEILLRAEENGKLYVATSAVPKVPEEEKCHACGAALGGAVYGRANGAWRLEAASPAAIYAGGWGGPPVGMELRHCGDRIYCFAVEDGFTGQGYTDVVLKVYGPVGGAMRSLLSVPVESDDPDGSTRLSAAVRFVPRASRSPFFDVAVMTVRQNCTKEPCRAVPEWKRYRCRDGQYTEVPSASLVQPRPKAK